MSTRTCRICGEIKELNEFPYQTAQTNFRGTGNLYYRKDCKACAATRARELRATGYTPTGKVNKYSVEERLAVSACRMRVQDAKQRAAKAGLRFDITGEYVYEVLLAQGHKCALSGYPLSLEKGHKDVLSLDQIRAGEGYVVGNVQWLSWSVNRAKGDLTLDEFFAMCAAIGRCNDYPVREYSQVAGSAGPNLG